MFTGLVETAARVILLERRGGAARVRIETPFASELRSGESVAVDGVCLTAVEVGEGWFEADVSPETLSCTTIGLRSSGDTVNLERPLRAGDRLGGHLVQGHVDGVGVVESVRPEGGGRRVRVRFADDLADFIVMKGSIAVDGVSLTLVDVGPDRFSVMLIPHTLAATTLGTLKPGDRVNIETDMLARHVRKLLGGLPITAGA